MIITKMKLGNMKKCPLILYSLASGHLSLVAFEHCKWGSSKLRCAARAKLTPDFRLIWKKVKILYRQFYIDYTLK
jgi:hypothetical protein